MVQQRSVAAAIVLSILTCGIYGLYWFECITDETNKSVIENTQQK